MIGKRSRPSRAIAAAIEACAAVAHSGGRLGEVGAHDTLPPGPYLVGLTHTPHGDMPPWTVVCGDGRAVCGHVPSSEIAAEICLALNQRAAFMAAGEKS